MSLTEDLHAASIQFSGYPALEHPDGTLTYQELYQRACELMESPDFSSTPAHIIPGKGSIDEFVKIFSCLLAGKPYIPLNSKFPPERIHKITQGVPLASPEFLQSIAYIIFTSGSTGEPKGVPISSKQISNHIQFLQSIIPLTKSDRFLQLFDFSFDPSIIGMALSWINGATLYTIPTSHLLMATRYAQENEITVWHSVPSVVSLAAKAGLMTPNSLPHIRLAIFGGEALPYETIKIFSEAAPNARLFNFWGPTEGTISMSHFEIDRSLLKSEHAPDSALSIMPIGYPHPDVELDILDGELIAHSDRLTSGYLNQPDLDEKAFFYRDGKRWYKTGDLATWDDRYGYLYLGRIDRQIKLKGYRIELQECESSLRKASACNDVSVIAWPISTLGATEGLIGFITNPSTDIALIHNHLMQHLPHYMIPDKLIALEALPLTINGKVDYKALENIASEHLS